jgi:O-antigen/teichoic acid export membrane protein
MTPEPATRPAGAPTLAAQVSRAVLWNTLFVPIKIVAEIVAMLLKLTLLKQASYGFLSLINSANNGLGTWIDLGTGRALPKYIPETLRQSGPRGLRRLLLVVIGAQAGMFALVGLGFALFRQSYFDDLQAKIVKSASAADHQQLLLSFVRERGWVLVLVVLALLLIGIVYDVLMAYLSSFFKQRAWNSIALVAQLLPPLLTVAVILARGDIPELLLAMVAAPTVATGLLVRQVLRHRREIAGAPQPPDDGRLLPPGFVRYCAVSLLMTGTDYLASPRFAAFFTSDLIVVAVLTAGVSVVQMVLSYLFTPMVGVQVPLFTRVRAGEGDLGSAYQSIIRLQVLLLVPGGVGLLMLAGPIFAILPQYAQAAEIVWVLVPCLFLECLLTTAHNVLIVYEKLRVIIAARVLTLVGLPLILLLVPRLGVVGAALAVGLARVLAGAWVTASGARLLGLRWPWRFTLRVALASAAMALAVAGLNTLVPALAGPAVPAAQTGSLALAMARLGQAGLVVLVAGAGALVLLAALRLLGGLDPADREQLAKLKLPLKKWVLKLL